LISDFIDRKVINTGLIKDIVSAKSGPDYIQELKEGISKIIE